jgi:cytochrome c553
MNKLLLTSIAFYNLAFASVDLVQCHSCHGQNFEKAALGQSKIVKDMSKQEVSDALIGYKYDTYGGKLKHLMNGNIKIYTDDELKNTGLGTKGHHHEPIQNSSLKLESCLSCHGHNFEKSALGKSKVVANMTKTEVTAALIGYKHGNYGGSMRHMMENHVKMYTDKELSQSNIGCDLYHKKIRKSSIDLASCKGCHGRNFEKAALGQSKIVANMTKEEVTNALLGYKYDTYGGNLKHLMNSNIKIYTDKQLKNTGIGQ